MRKVFFICFTIFIQSCYSQILQVTSDGLVLVKDSASNVRITTDFYSNYKGEFRNSINNNSNWMLENSRKYLLPTIEEDSFIVLHMNDNWGAVKMNGEEKSSFGFKYPMDFFKKGKCYGFHNIGSTGTYRLMGEYYAYENNYRIKNLNGEVLVNYSELIYSYRNSFFITR